MKTLVLGLGNDLLGDDAVGVMAVRELGRRLPDGAVDLCETALHGLALMDFFIGYERAIIIDAIITGQHPVGTVLTLQPGDFAPVAGPSPHYTGLPEVMALARAMKIPFPSEIAILAVEILGPTVIGARPSAAILAALPDVVDRVTATLDRWSAPFRIGTAGSSPPRRASAPPRCSSTRAPGAS